MTVLVTGSTGIVGSAVTRELVGRGLGVRALTRRPDRAHFPDGVQVVKGEMTDTEAMREVLHDATGLFLLLPASSEELTQGVMVLGLAQEAGVRNIVYLSAIHADSFTDVAHFASKAALERMILDQNLSATILRPSYYMHNDGYERARICDEGVYARPIGNSGVLMTDTRDLAEVAALSLLRREEADGALPPETIDVVGPEVLTGNLIAALWTEAVGRPVKYGGDDLGRFETQMRDFAPSWMAYDLRRMMQRFQRAGTTAAPGDDARLQKLLGRPMRSYRDFVKEAAASWTT